MRLGPGLQQVAIYEGGSAAHAMTRAYRAGVHFGMLPVDGTFLESWPEKPYIKRPSVIVTTRHNAQTRGGSWYTVHLIVDASLDFAEIVSRARALFNVKTKGELDERRGQSSLFTEGD